VGCLGLLLRPVPALADQYSPAGRLIPGDVYFTPQLGFIAFIDPRIAANGVPVYWKMTASLQVPVTWPAACVDPVYFPNIYRDVMNGTPFRTDLFPPEVLGIDHGLSGIDPGRWSWWTIDTQNRPVILDPLPNPALPAFAIQVTAGAHDLIPVPPDYRTTVDGSPGFLCQYAEITAAHSYPDGHQVPELLECFSWFQQAIPGAGGWGFQLAYPNAAAPIFMSFRARLVSVANLRLSGQPDLGTGALQLTFQAPYPPCTLTYSVQMDARQ